MNLLDSMLSLYLVEEFSIWLHSGNVYNSLYLVLMGNWRCINSVGINLALYRLGRNFIVFICSPGFLFAVHFILFKVCGFTLFHGFTLLFYYFLQF